MLSDVRSVRLRGVPPGASVAVSGLVKRFRGGRVVCGRMRVGQRISKLMLEVRRSAANGWRLAKKEVYRR